MLGSVAEPSVCTCRNGDAKGARTDEGNTAMKIVPARIEEQINRVDRNQSLAIGIGSSVTALWCAYRLIWLFYTMVTFSSVGFSAVSLVFPLVLWGVIGVIATVSAIGFLTRYAKGV